MRAEEDGLAVRLHEPLARHTAWRTGGRCDAFVVVHRRDALVRVVEECRSVDWKWTLLGAGTRVVVRDGGISGVVLRLGTDFGRMVDRGADGLEAGAAVPVPALVAAAAARGLRGLERFANIPGSLGASLQLDEGWEDVVESVSFLHRNKIRVAALDAVQGRKRILTGATLLLAPGEPTKIDTSMRAQLDPARCVPPSAWYEQPRKHGLRKVLRSVELPRVRLRRVAIPDAAPELLVNLGEGTASDLALLHRSATERVKKTRGVELQPRVRWLGRRATQSSNPEGGI